MTPDLGRRSRFEAAALALVSSVCLAAALALAGVHPLLPAAALAAVLGVAAFSTWQPWAGLLAIPVLLPVLDFSPWSGWLIVDEFDLLVLAVAAGGYLRMLGAGSRLTCRRATLFLLALVALLLVRGADGLTLSGIDLFSGYESPSNSLRVLKTLLWTTLLLPLLAHAARQRPSEQLVTRFFGACLLGCACVVAALFWERSFHPGLLDMSTPYRTVALFWEMHLGGGALDAYLVLLAPLLVWAWRTGMPAWRRLVLGLFVLAFAYGCLTTISRGVYGAIAGSLLLLASLLVWQRRGGGKAPRVRASSVVVLSLVLLEGALVLGAGSFVNQRLEESERDIAGRLQHWRQGIGLLQTSDDWLFGIGVGRVPLRFARADSGVPVPGSHQRGAASGASMVLSGPSPGGAAADGLYALSQRVDLLAAARYRVAIDARSDRDAELLIRVCALHLLYPKSCQRQSVRLSAGGSVHRESLLAGNPFAVVSWQRAWHGVVLVSVLTPGANVELDKLQLSAGGADLLRNGQFIDGAANWFPLAQSNFLPWHIDNLYLEILIESGVVGLGCFLALVLSILWRLLLACRRGDRLAPFFIASLAGLLALGLLISLFDMPRVATLFCLFLLWAWQFTRRAAAG